MKVDFPITSEKNVREAFVRFANEFGYKVLESREKFPDYILEDQKGNKVLAEAELLASNAHAHGHDLTECDLLICWFDDLNSEVVDVLELDEQIGAPDTPDRPLRTVSEYSVDGSFKKAIRLGGDPGENVYMRVDSWKRNDEETYRLKSVVSGSLNATEFECIFRQLPVDVRERAFVESDLSALVRWFEDLDYPKAAESGTGKIELATTYNSSGDKKSLRIQPDDPHIRIDWWEIEDGKKRFRTPHPGSLNPEELAGVLEPIPPTVREQVFVECNLHALSKWVTE